MIQFNLLPDVKQQYIKAKRQKHTVIVVALLSASVSLFVFIMLFLTVYVFQKNHLKNLDEDIAVSTKTLKSTPDLDKVLTIQNQLNSLPGLHDQKPVMSRLFGYITQITPAQVSIGQTAVDFEGSSISFSGTADSLSTINKFVDTMKFTTLKIDGEETEGNPFSDVVLSSFSRSEKEASYQITLLFDPSIFDSSKNVELVIPKIISTRSETEKPTDVFKDMPVEQKTGTGGNQ